MSHVCMSHVTHVDAACHLRGVTVTRKSRSFTNTSTADRGAGGSVYDSVMTTGVSSVAWCMLLQCVL